MSSMDDETTRTLARAASAGDAAAADRLGDRWLLVHPPGWKRPYCEAVKLVLTSFGDGGQNETFPAWGTYFSEFSALLEFAARNGPTTKWGVVHESSKRTVAFSLMRLRAAAHDALFAMPINSDEGPGAFCEAAPGWSSAADAFGASPFPESTTFSGTEAAMLEAVRISCEGQVTSGQSISRVRQREWTEAEHTEAMAPLALCLTMMFEKRGLKIPPATAFSFERNPPNVVVRARGAWVADPGCTCASYV